ncbi:MAG: tyrosine-type recombinase/integrase [Clostridia bacterium]|nr:tyrosine-type recombinase/integrase [Clostridia bacterium]
MIMLMYTGLRVGEALALTWDDINFKEKLIEVNKSIIYIPV